MRLIGSVLWLIKAISLLRNWPVVMANAVQLRADSDLEYALRNGMRYRAWAGTLSIHVVNVLFEVVGRDAYGLRELDRDVEVIVDIGAHIGAFSVCAARKWPTAKLYAYEPVPENYGYCRGNLRANHVLNATIRNLGVASSAGTRTFHLSESSPGDHSIYTATGKAVQLPVVSLNEILASVGSENIDLLKMDCEGAEYEILMSVDNETLNRIERITMEVHVVSGGTRQELVSKLNRSGFSVRHGTKDGVSMLYATRVRRPSG